MQVRLPMLSLGLRFDRYHGTRDIGPVSATIRLCRRSEFEKGLPRSEVKRHNDSQRKYVCPNYCTCVADR